MPDYELERLKSQELEAYHRKKAAWKAYANARAQTSAAYEVMQAASEKRRSARDKLNHATRYGTSIIASAVLVRLT